MFLTKAEIRAILNNLSWRDVYDNGSMRLQERTHGYSADPETARLQGKLSIMLEAAKE